MTDITPEAISRVAKLSHLALTDAEQAKATQDLTGILGHFAQIQKIDTANISPATDITGLTNVVRPDEAKPNMLTTSDVLLSAAPHTKDREVKVPAVL